MSIEKNQSQPCRHCGAQDGWWEKRVCKYRLIFEPNGDVYASSDMERVSGGKQAFCLNCNGEITKEIDLS